MEFRQIQYFLVICKYRNISHAAKAIHLSQQALSKQIHELEEELGVSLFIRSTKGVELTRYAQKLEAPARQMLEQEELDLAVTIDGRANPPLVKKLVSMEPAYILFSNQNQAMQRDPFTAEDLRQQRILISQFDSWPQ